MYAPVHVSVRLRVRHTSGTPARGQRSERESEGGGTRRTEGDGESEREKKGEKGKGDKRARAHGEVKREGRDGGGRVPPRSHPSFARHHVERCTGIGAAFSLPHARARAREDVSSRPLYRVNVRSNALLNNVRPYTYAGERRTFTSLSRQSKSRSREAS